jgi:hypothetical protein
VLVREDYGFACLRVVAWRVLGLDWNVGWFDVGVRGGCPSDELVWGMDGWKGVYFTCHDPSGAGERCCHGG